MTATTDINRSQDSEIDRLVAELDAVDGGLPEESIRRIREIRDVAIPALIQVLRRAAQMARAGEAPQENAHFIALFLLAEFRAAEALPAIVEAMSLPGELSYDLFGDAISEVLSRILADLAADRLEVIDGLIANSEINDSVRWAVAETYVFLIRDGRMSREDAVQRLRQQLIKALADNDKPACEALIIVLDNLATGEALSEIEQAFERDLIDPLLSRIEEVRSGIALGERRVNETLERCPPTGIQDAVAELREWPLYRQDDVRPGTMLHNTNIDEEATWGPVLQPIVREMPRIGRNDPCPCGSGKKFKKCCGGAPKQAR